MFSFRVDDSAAREVQASATRLGVDRSELLREALRRDLLRLASERDAEIWTRQPLTADEQSFGAIND